MNVAAAAHRFFDQMHLPLPDPSVEPPGGTVVNLAAIFAAGDGRPLTGTFRLGPLTVTVTARPTYWDWTFEAGVTERFAAPGGRYPDEAVSYLYRTPGTRVVRVTTTWTATYVINASGPIHPVAGVVTRTAALAVPVGKAGAHLVSY